MGSELFANPAFGFWLSIYAISISVLILWLVYYFAVKKRAVRRITWDLHTQYIDISEFSNRNIPLRVSYKGTEPRWLWATYVSLRNSGRQDITSADTPDKQHVIIGQKDCRYIGFNRLISAKAKVTLSPLFTDNDVYCKVEFDKLGPGDEILLSLLFVADEKQRIEVDGSFFGSGSMLVNGYLTRMQSWRSLWWLLLLMVGTGIIGGIVLLRQAIYSGQIILYHFQTLLVMYMLGLIAAALFLRPIRFWQQIPERFQDQSETGSLVHPLWRTLRFILGLSNEP